MVHVERTFDVQAPPEVVVPYLADFTNAEEWDPGTLSCKRVGDGPVAVGAHWHNVSQFQGREVELDYELIELSPTKVRLRGTNESATSTDDITVVPSGGGSRITYSATVEFSGMVKVFGPFLQPGFNKLADKTEEQLVAALSAKT
jgi:carbon monoxide dehydrogenase subunit G